MAATAMNSQASLATRGEVHEEPVQDTADLQGIEVTEAVRQGEGASRSIDDIKEHGEEVAAIAIPKFAPVREN